MNQNADQIIDGLFRGYFSKAVAALTRIFGTYHIELAEEVVQESLLKAVTVWRIRGVPQKPEAWLYRTAKNLAIDVLRREKNFHRKKEEIAYELEHSFTPSFDVHGDALIKDDQLKLLFISCHPLLSYEAQLCLTLKVVGGLSVDEIARAFLTNAETVAQRIVRAKRKIREADLRFELPAAKELSRRIDAILNVIYLLFNEGYGTLEGEYLIREDLCIEALRLISMLVMHPAGNVPKAHALKALLLFQASRLPARIDKNGALVLLAHQDCSLWDKDMITTGFHHMMLSKSGDELSQYHLQAGIAAEHCMAQNDAGTNWASIVWYYDELLQLHHSPIFVLNRAIAMSYTKGTAAALTELETLRADLKMKTYYLYHAVVAEMLQRCSEHQKALASYTTALALARTGPEKAFLLGKIKALR